MTGNNPLHLLVTRRCVESFRVLLSVNSIRFVGNDDFGFQNYWFGFFHYQKRIISNSIGPSWETRLSKVNHSEIKRSFGLYQNVLRFALNSWVINLNTRLDFHSRTTQLVSTIVVDTHGVYTTWVSWLSMYQITTPSPNSPRFTVSGDLSF